MCRKEEGGEGEEDEEERNEGPVVVLVLDVVVVIEAGHGYWTSVSVVRVCDKCACQKSEGLSGRVYM